MLLSGGIDSSACLNFYKTTGRTPCALFVDYGQLASRSELRAAQAIASHYGVDLKVASWRGVLDKGVGSIVGRNAFLLSVALMESPPTVSIAAVGVHSGTDYTDCSEKFIEKMQSVYDVYTDGKVQVAAPFVTWSKGEVFAYAISEDVPIELTYSCEAGTDDGCGKCFSCQDREVLAAHA